MGMYEKLIADGWWLGRYFELWLLQEQRRLYGEYAIATPEIQSALDILTEQHQTSAA